MTAVMMGDISDAIAQTVAQALPYVEASTLNAIIRETVPECGIIIEASRSELQAIAGNILYREVVVVPKESEAKKNENPQA